MPRLPTLRGLQIRWHALSCCWLLGLLLIVVPLSASAMSLVVHAPPHQETCIFFRTLKGQDTVVRGSYEIVNDKTRNPLPLTFRVYNEKREALYTSLHNSQQGTFELLHDHSHSADPVMNDKSERWSVCMENGKVNLYHPFHWDQEQSEKNAKLVSLSILAEPKHPPGFAAFTKEQKTQYVVLGSMAHKIDDILHHMNHMRVREAEHRDLAEQTYSGLIFWTIVLFVCLVAVAVGQVLAIMRFFQAQKKLYF